MEGQNCCGGRIAGIGLGAAMAIAIVYMIWSIQTMPPAPMRQVLGTRPATRPAVAKAARTTRPITEDMLGLAGVPWGDNRNAAEPQHLSGINNAAVPWVKGRKKIEELSAPDAPSINNGRGNNYRIGSSEVSVARVPWSRSSTRPTPETVDTAKLPKDFQKTK